MKRNLEDLKKKRVDLLVIGGGIHGAMLFWRASICGLKTALIEKSDFAGATSANSQKIIHGGLRYLQTLNLPRIRQSVRERRRLLKIAPHLVRPLPCIMPLYGHGMKGREAMWAGLHAYNVLSLDRNQNLPPSHHIPGGRIINSSETLKTVPGLTGNGLLGGASWSDGICLNTERLVIDFIKAACKNGGTAANYTEAIGILKQKNQVKGVEAFDQLKKESFKIEADQVAACVGPWMNNFFALPGPENRVEPITFASAVNVVVKRRFSPTHAFAVRSKTDKGRLFFVVPWNGKSIIGTEYFHYKGAPESFSVKSEECEKLIYEFNLCYPEARLKKHDISFVHKGLLPCASSTLEKNQPPKLTSQFRIIDFESHGLRGLIGVLGVKYTTAGYVAERVLSRLFPKAARKNTSQKECTLSGDIPNYSEPGEELKKECLGSFTEDEIESLITSFGSEYKKVLKLVEVDANGKIKRGSFIKAITLFSIREEMAVTISDVLLRRSSIASSGLPEPAVIEETARFMQQELDWNDEKLEVETDAFYRSFPLL